MNHTRIPKILVVVMMTLGLILAPVADVQGYDTARPASLAPGSPAAVLWDQPLSTDHTAWYSTEFTDTTADSSYLADDFTNTNPWVINTIFVPGEFSDVSTVTLADADLLTFMIFADNAGVPAGDPSGGGADPVWELSVAPGNAQIALSAGTSGKMSNVTLTLYTPINLPAGHYWLVFFPTLTFSVDGEYGRQPSDTTHGGIGQFINPDGGRGLGNSWQPWTNLSAPDPLPQDIAFRLEGSIGTVPDIDYLYLPFIVK